MAIKYKEYREEYGDTVNRGQQIQNIDSLAFHHYDFSLFGNLKKNFISIHLVGTRSYPAPAIYKQTLSTTTLEIYSLEMRQQPL